MASEDPLVPIADEDRGFRTWMRSEIYEGPDGTGVYVPNVNDLVVDYTQGFMRVIEVDSSTGLSTLGKWEPPSDDDGVSDEDVLLGAGPGYQSESFRVFINTGVMPHTLAIDSRVHDYGSTVTSVKVFLGTDIGETGKVISAFYDQGGTLLGENIPMELVTTPDAENRAIKAPMVGYTNSKLADGEVVTVVSYDVEGTARSLRKMLVKNTAFIRTTDASRRVVTAIRLESPFLSATDDSLLQYPINMPVAALPLTGVVVYSDGEKRMPIDGTSFKLFGLKEFIATVSGQKIPLVLSYYFSEDEYNYGAQMGQQTHLSVSYQATTLAMDGAFEIKLFAYPVWVNAEEGYRLEFFLYNLNREKVYNVTPYVRVAANSAAFDPVNYNQVQHVTFQVNMRDVDGGYPAYNHAQTMNIALKTRGDEDNTNWLMGFSPNQDPEYGYELAARVDFIDVDNWDLDLSNGFNSKEEWLNHLYYPIEPLYNAQSETRAPEPNYYVVVVGSREIECHASEWAQKLEGIPFNLAEGELVYIKWLYRSTSGDLQLGISGLPVHQNP